MSITLLIADDEYFIRQRLKRIIPFTPLNITLVGEAENGVDVLKILQEKQVDIVLLDIHMPKITGTEVAEYIHHNFPETQIIMLSGYNEFEYARCALKNGVFDYLLKPVNSDALLSSLESCIEKISSRKHEHLKIKSFEQHMFSKTLTDVRDEAFGIEDFFKEYPDFLCYKYSAYIGIYAEKETSTDVLKLADAIQRQFNLYCHLFHESEHIYCLQLFFHNEENINSIVDFIKGYETCINSYSFFAIDYIFPIKEHWTNFYKRVMTALDRRYFSVDRIFVLADALETEAVEKFPLEKLRQNIIQSLNSKSFSVFEDFINSTFEIIMEKQSVEFLFSFINELFIIYQMHYKIPTNLDTSIAKFISAIMEDEYTCQSLKETILHYGNQCINAKIVQPSELNYCNKIMNYVEKNYSNSGLTVASIAEHFHLNSSYLGTIFKNTKDQSLLQYITGVRLEAAKSLLSTGTLSVSDIASAVGYSDVFYFSKCFKRNYGCSPTEFIRSMK